MHASDCGLHGDAECTCHQRAESRLMLIEEERRNRLREAVYTVEICPRCFRQEPHPHGKYRWQCQCGLLLFVDADEAATRPHYKQPQRIDVVVRDSPWLGASWLREEAE
jgi:hypothetical protein